LLKRELKFIATDIQNALLQKVVTEIQDAIGDAIAVLHDVTSTEDCQKVVSTAIESFGKVDILINNAEITGQIGQTIKILTRKFIANKGREKHEITREGSNYNRCSKRNGRC
jgi:NAD(P)-dependent dehydrogenase (short-subunit alcohol dehydrogenase family)